MSKQCNQYDKCQGDCGPWCTGYAKTNRMSKDEYYLGIALAVSKRSSCIKRHYGCVIVKDDIIIATGYNGSPRGEENCCDRGSCSRMDKPHNTGDYSDCHSVHAEQNALIAASRDRLIGATLYLAGEERKWSEVNQSFFDWKEVQDCSPCLICSRMIKNAGVCRVVSNSK